MSAWIGPVVAASVISSLITVLGWIVNWRITRRREGERRQERIIDVQTALLAEIRSTAHTLGQHDRETVMAEVKRKLEQPGSGYTPFVPREPESPVFDAVIGEISILPTEVIDPVILLYRQVQVIDHLAEDLRGDRFAKLPVEQQLQMLGDLLDLKAYGHVLAQQAMEALMRSLGLSKQASVPSGRQLAGED